MGYYTRFTVQEPQIWTEQMKQDLADIQPGYFEDSESVQAFIDDEYDDMKWYDHEEDMKKLSSRHPETLFVIHGHGEEGDQWIGYFKNGKSFISSGKLLFEPYGESKLK